MASISGLIKELSNEGCTDYEAMEMTIKLIKIDRLKESFGHDLDKDRLHAVLNATDEATELERALFNSLDKLSSRELQCFVMNTVELMSFNRIAGELEISKGSVQRYIERAREKLKVGEVVA